MMKGEERRKQTKTMGAIYINMFNFFVLTLFSQYFHIAAYTLKPSDSIVDGQSLISQGGTFKLGFFSPSPNSKNRFLGIWYNTIPTQTVVWIANRDTPLNETSGVLNISTKGNLTIENGAGSVIWSSYPSNAVENPILEFLESGNLVLRDERNGDPNSYLWQSFDYPTDTLLPGMKLGWNLKTGLNRNLTTWRNTDDPSRGDFTYGMDLTGYPELMMWNGSNKYYRSGPWNGLHLSSSDLKPNTVFTFDVINNAEEVYYIYNVNNQSELLRLVLTQTSTEAHLERDTWSHNTNNWVTLLRIPRDRCDVYALCGAYSTCDISDVDVCKCLKGFKPKSPQDWNGADWSQGCEHEVPLNCTGGDGFVKFSGMKWPQSTDSWVNTSMDLEECRVKCLHNCSCTAYANTDIRGDGSGCIMWLNDLIDIRQLNGGRQDIYIRMAASELDSEAKSRTKGSVAVIVSITSVAGAIVLGLGGWCIWKKRSPRGVSESDDFELPMYDLITITSATNNFSEENKLGEGGFGSVYKGKLECEQDIAVKRLSKDSTQGVDEFKNEVILISKLQHRNLVRLLGCCIQREEKMLVYEYMQNKSLDSFLFDETKKRLLDWKTRFDIILGIGRGLLYLHHDSRLRIIHRDLKASNVLLDSEMVPKISDFGMARIFRGDQIEGKTRRVVGTYGYMSPEYAIDGHFSVKSDVFSFGVLVLEIITGKKNRGFFHPEHELNLLGHAWRLWNEGKSIELVDEVIRKSCLVEDVLRCIHVGLLCVQKGAEQRPPMPSVMLMLSSETAVLPRPQAPGFYVERSFIISDSSHSGLETYNSNDFTITLVDAR